MAHQNVVHRNALVSHMSVDNPAVQQKVQGMQHNYMLHNMTPDVALKSAYQTLEYMVMKQAAVLSYMDVFFYLGLMFLACIPFMLVIKAKKNKKIDLSEAMH